MNTSTKSNEQAVVDARLKIADLKNDYMNSLLPLVQKNLANDHIPLSMLIECQKKGNIYFNYVENFVGDSGLLGAHENGLWVTGFAEDCHAVLESLAAHFKFLRSYYAEVGNNKIAIEPTSTAYANMQRLVVEYLSTETVNKLKCLLLENKLPIGGFDMPAAETVNKIPKWQLITGVILGVIGLIAIVSITMLIPNPTSWQTLVFRGVFAISLSLIAPIIPGFVHLTSKLRMRGAYFVVVAGGSIAIFVLIWLINPPNLSDSHQSPPQDKKDSPSQRYETHGNQSPIIPDNKGSVIINGTPQNTSNQEKK